MSIFMEYHVHVVYNPPWLYIHTIPVRGQPADSFAAVDRAPSVPLHFEDCFSPVERPLALRTMLVPSTSHDWLHRYFSHTIDFIDTFLSFSSACPVACAKSSAFSSCNSLFTSFWCLQHSQPVLPVVDVPASVTNSNGVAAIIDGNSSVYFVQAITY